MRRAHEHCVESAAGCPGSENQRCHVDRARGEEASASRRRRRDVDEERSDGARRERSSAFSALSALALRIGDAAMNRLIDETTDCYVIDRGRCPMMVSHRQGS